MVLHLPRNTTTYTHTLTSTIATFTVSGNLTINSYIGSSTTRIGNGVFNIGSGTVTVNGSVTTVNANTVNVSTLSMATGAQTGTLVLGGATPFTISGTGTSTTTLNGTGATVNYNYAGAQTVRVVTYKNLTLSGSGVKTTTGVTVNGILSMEGTATASAAPTYGAAATLQYNTATSRTAGVEWITPFAATGGVIIANTGTITLNAAKVFNASVPLTINNGATLSTSASNYNLSIGGSWTNNGTFIAGTSTTTFTGATQTIGGTSSTTFYNIIIASGASYTLNNNINIGGSWTNNGTFTAGTYTITFNGTTQTIGGTSSTTFGTIIIASSGTLTLTRNITLSGDLTIISGTYDLGTYTCNRTATGGTFTLMDAGYLRIGGNSGFSNGSTAYDCNFPSNFSTDTLSSHSRVEYYLTGDQDVVYDNLSYGKLILSGSGTKLARQIPKNPPSPLRDSCFTVNDSLIIRSGVTLDFAQYVFYGVLNGVVNIDTLGTLDCNTGTGTVKTWFLGPTLNAIGTYLAADANFGTPVFSSETRFGNVTINGHALTLYDTRVTGYTTSNVSITTNAGTTGKAFTIESGGTFNPAANVTVTFNTLALKVIGTMRVTRSSSNAAEQYIGTGTRTYTTGTVEFAGTTETVDNVAWGNLLMSGTVSLNASMTTAPVGNLTVTGTFNLSTYTINGNSSGKVLTLGPTGILQVGGTSGGVTGSNFPTGYTGTPSISLTSRVLYNGIAVQAIANTVIYGILEVNNTAGVNLDNGTVTADSLRMTAGNMTTGANVMRVTKYRDGNGLIIGTIRQIHPFVVGTTYYYEGPNTYIIYTAMGNTPDSVTITSYPNKGIPVGDSTKAIKRYYNIVTSGGSGDTATLRLHYDTAERNSLNEASLTLWRYNGSAWEDQGEQEEGPELRTPGYNKPDLQISHSQIITGRLQ